MQEWYQNPQHRTKMRTKFRRGLGPDSRFVRTLEKQGISLHPAHVKGLKETKPRERRKVTSAIESLVADSMKKAEAPRLFASK